MAKRARTPRHNAESNTYRFFVDADTIVDHAVQIRDAGLVHQIATVLRLGSGSRVTLLDNSGWEYSVVLTNVSRNAIDGALEERRPVMGEPSLQLALYIALIKAERFEWVLQKGTEIGASLFVPVVTERSIVEDAAEIRANKRERWERIIREAAEQSRRGKLPRLLPPCSFASACQSAAQAARTLLLWEGAGGTSLRSALASSDMSPSIPADTALALFSGPGGGWTEGEIATAITYNVTLITLGSRTLRAETAPIVAAAAIFYEFGDLG